MAEKARPSKDIPSDLQFCVVGLEGYAGHWTSSVHLVYLVLNVRPMEMEEKQGGSSYPMLVRKDASPRSSNPLLFLRR